MFGLHKSIKGFQKLQVHNPKRLCSLLHLVYNRRADLESFFLLSLVIHNRVGSWIGKTVFESVPIYDRNFPGHVSHHQDVPLLVFDPLAVLFCHLHIEKLILNRFQNKI